MNADIDLVIKHLTDQIANLSKDKAIYFALATQREQECRELKLELEKMKENVEPVNKNTK